MRWSLVVVVVAFCPVAAAATSGSGQRGTIAYTLAADLWTVEADGRRPIRVTRGGFGTEPSWSADGRRILFVRRDDGALYSMRPDGRDVRLVFRPRRQLAITDPDWAADGRIVFAGLAPFTADAFGRPNGVWVVDRGGRELRRLARSGSSPAWSPDGTRIAFTDRVGLDRWAVMVVASEGGTPTRVVDGHSPAWSPDGHRLAFVAPSGAVMVASVDGSNPRTIVECGTAPAWSPDGRLLAYLSCRSDFRRQLYVVASLGGTPRRLTRYAGSYGAPDWRPAG